MVSPKMVKNLTDPAACYEQRTDNRKSNNGKDRVNSNKVVFVQQPGEGDVTGK